MMLEKYMLLVWALTATIGSIWVGHAFVVIALLCLIVASLIKGPKGDKGDLGFQGAQGRDGVCRCNCRCSQVLP